MQPDLAVGVGDAFAGQQRVQPGQRPACLGTPPIAMVAVVEAQRPTPVDGQTATCRWIAQPPHRQQQKKGVIGERMPTRAHTGVPDLAKADLCHAGLSHPIPPLFHS